MRRFLVAILLALIVAACSSPVQPAPEVTRVSSPSAEPTPQPTREHASPLLETEIIYMHPSKVDNTTLPTTAVEDLHRTGQPQDYDINTYHLVVEGLVENPLSLSYEDLLSRPQVSELVLLICPGFFWDNAVWTGTPLKPILTEAGISPQASQIRIVGGGGYTRTISLEDAMADGVFLAYEVNGETLPRDHGYPIRLVMRHHFGNKWVKWIERIEVIE